MRRVFKETRVVGLFEGTLGWKEATRHGGAPLGRERGGRPAGGSNKLDFALTVTSSLLHTSHGPKVSNTATKSHDKMVSFVMHGGPPRMVLRLAPVDVCLHARARAHGLRCTGLTVAV